MSTVPFKNANHQSWQKLCEAAVLELDSAKLPYRILEAEAVIAKRMKELEAESGDHIEEREALEDAAYALRALRSTLKVPSASTAGEA